MATTPLAPSRPESPDRPGKRDAKAHKHREAGHDKPDNRGKEKPGKDKNK